MHASGLHMVARGFLKLTKGGTLVSILTSNDFFGEESLLAEAPSTLTITTITPSQYMVLETDRFFELLELYPQMKRTFQRYTRLKASKDRRTEAERADVNEKSQQLHKVRLELKRTSHFLPVEARQRLDVEIHQFAASIRRLYETMRRSSPAYQGGGGLISRFRRSSQTPVALALELSRLNHRKQELIRGALSDANATAQGTCHGIARRHRHHHPCATLCASRFSGYCAGCRRNLAILCALSRGLFVRRYSVGEAGFGALRRACDEVPTG